MYVVNIMQIDVRDHVSYVRMSRIVEINVEYVVTRHRLLQLC